MSTRHISLEPTPSSFFERSSCPFCAEASSDSIAEIDYHATIEANRKLPNIHGALFACHTCGVAYPSHVYDVANFAALYQKTIESLDHFHRSTLNDLRQFVIKEILRNRAKRFSVSTLLDVLSLRSLLVPRFGLRPHGLRILDVGCGFGDFAQAFRELGNAVEATEIFPALVERMRSNGFECHLAELERVDFGGRKFDLIIMRGTFYRTRDPATTIETAKRLLAEGGEVACIDPCPGRLGAEFFLRIQFPQGQFYITDRRKYRTMLEQRYGLVMSRERLLYGRPEAHQTGTSSSIGHLLEFGELLLGNLLRRKSYVLAYTLRPIPQGEPTHHTGNGGM